MTRGSETSVPYQGEVLPSLRQISRHEWERWIERNESVPICCDPSWGEALRAGYGNRFKPRVWLAEYPDAEELIAAYEDREAFIPHLTLSPLGFSCGIARRGHLPRFDRTVGALRRAIRWRYSSVSYRIPFWIPNSPSPSALHTLATTHALDLDAPYSSIFRTRFKAGTRRAIRRAEREGLKVIVTTDPRHLREYYDLRTQLAERKGDYSMLLPLRLIESLAVRSSKCELVVTVLDGNVVAGGLFLDDGPSMFYAQGVSDRRFKSLQPGYALLGHQIEAAQCRGKRYFNFGPSAGVRSLEQFKEGWGATKRMDLAYTHRHAAVARLATVRRALKSRRHMGR